MTPNDHFKVQICTWDLGTRWKQIQNIWTRKGEDVRGNKRERNQPNRVNQKNKILNSVEKPNSKKGSKQEKKNLDKKSA